jgi:two-component system, NtrC family, nitrogen regulation response regulator GlnG
MNVAQGRYGLTHADLTDASAFAGCAPTTLERAARSDLPVLISGSTGVGKDVIARALHNHSPRHSGPFVSVNVGVIAPDSIEPELFGEDKAVRAERHGRGGGALQRAEGGTLFLDEVTDLPLPVQQRLLRELCRDDENRSPATETHAPRIRMISASRMDVFPLVEQNAFHRELFFELSVIPLRVLPLSGRRKDVAQIAKYIFSRTKLEGLSSTDITADALEQMAHYEWPGDLAELEALVWRLAALYPQDRITAEVVAQQLSYGPQFRGYQASSKGTPNGFSEIVAEYLSFVFREHAPSLPPAGLYQRILRELELPLFSAALSATRGNQIKAARLLGLNRNTLRKKVRELENVTIRLTH